HPRLVCTLLPHRCAPPPAPLLYTLSLHDALPTSQVFRILPRSGRMAWNPLSRACLALPPAESPSTRNSSVRPRSSLMQSASLPRSEEHTSELQSRENLVCRLLLEKKKDQRRSTRR